MSLTRQKFILFICIFSLYTRTVYANDSVGVLLTGPEKAAVGEKVSFEVELVNRSGTVLSQLRVIDYFDKGLSHAVSSSPIEQAGTIVLAAGTSRRLTLEFQVTELGRQCHRVEVIDQSNKSVGSGTACVEVVPRNSPAAAQAAAQAAAGGNPVPSTKPAQQQGPGQQGPGPVRSEANSSQPDSLSQPSSSAVLPRLAEGVQVHHRLMQEISWSNQVRNQEPNKSWVRNQPLVDMTRLKKNLLRCQLLCRLEPCHLEPCHLEIARQQRRQVRRCPMLRLCQHRHQRVLPLKLHSLGQPN